MAAKGFRGKTKCIGESAKLPVLVALAFDQSAHASYVHFVTPELPSTLIAAWNLAMPLLFLILVILFSVANLWELKKKLAAASSLLAAVFALLTFGYWFAPASCLLFLGATAFVGVYGIQIVLLALILARLRCGLNDLFVAYIVGDAFSQIMFALPVFWVEAFCLIMIACVTMVVWQDAEIPLGHERKDLSIRDLALAQPSSFLPSTSIVFTAGGLVMFITSLCSSASSITDGGYYPILGVIPLGIAMIAPSLCARTKKPFRPEALVSASCVVVLAGLLLILARNLNATPLGVYLTSAGADVIVIFSFWFIIGPLAEEVPLSTFKAIPWYWFLMSACLSLGRCGASLIEGESCYELALVAMAMGLVVFQLMKISPFNISSTLQQVAPIYLENSEAGAPDINDVGAILAEQAGLTPRETEVMLLLARGRNVPAIKEELFISRNTVRVHVQHIYEKMDVHSQQDLITKVEQAAASARVR